MNDFDKRINEELDYHNRNNKGMYVTGDMHKFSFEIGFRDGASFAKRTIWHNVKNMLPPDDTSVVIYADNGRIDIADYEDGMFFRNANYAIEDNGFVKEHLPFNNVTHWMLLPEEPEE